MTTSTTCICVMALPFFFTDPATAQIYTLSLHDALPISVVLRDLAQRLAGSVGVVKVLAGRPSDRKSTRLNSSHVSISYAVFCLKKKKKHNAIYHTSKEKITCSTSPSSTHSTNCE